MQNQDNKWAIVTGASIRGGLAISKRLHNDGFSIVVHHSNDASYSRAHALVNELNSIRPGSAIRWQADLEINGPFPYGDINVAAVICNASFLENSQCGDIDKGIASFNMHVTGHAAILASVEKQLKENRGCIIAVTDIQIHQPNKDYIWYHVAKAGLETLIRTLAVEWAPAIRCNCIAPGTLQWAEGWKDEERRQNIMNGIPLNRIGDFEELASTVAWLVSDATYITGQTIRLDGGRSIWLR